MIVVYYILAALLVWFSYRSLRGGFEYLNYFRQELAKPRSEYAPFVSLIAPCKGLDEGLRENLAALLEQDYPDYEVIFVVESESDAAVRIIEDVSRKGAKTAARSSIVVAPAATHSGQKVENLREAVLHVSPESRVFVFVDSDARPSKGWLRSLVAPLEDGNVGASTGYRWFISKTPTFASELRNIWNASIASALGPNTKDNFCWGGSMAIRRDTFEELELRSKWSGTLSDDFTVTRAMNAAKMKIVFVPLALTASVENCTFREMLEFTTRQMKITRVYSQRLWLLSFIGAGLFCSVMIASLSIVIFSARNDVAVWVAIATIALVSVCSVGKSWLRLKAARLVLSQYETELEKQAFPQCTLWLLSPFVFLLNSIAALFSRRMMWRGIEYEMVSAHETKIRTGR